jgi:poly-gamma-glutamate capsule biosynthesis protein CapA/YwtB (metallophosphatase superfamily)
MTRVLSLLLCICACAPRAVQPGPHSPLPESPRPAGSEAPARPVTPGLLSLLVGGDVTLGFHYEEHFDSELAKGKSRDELYDYGFRNVLTATHSKDLFLVNLECPFTDRGEKIPKNFNFKARPELVASLLAGRVDVVSLANNHLMDYGAIGLLDTLATLDQAGIAHFGAGRNLAEARRPRIIEKNGIKTAFLGYFFLGDKNIEPKEVIASDTTPGVAGHASDLEIMKSMMLEDIGIARTMADLVIPFFHWGREGQNKPEPYQIALAHAAIEAGAALVLGSHPHVLQGIEVYRERPIVYSLGNFVFGGNWNPRVKDSALFRATLSSAGFQSAEILPIKTDKFPELPIQPYLLEGTDAEAVLKNLATYSSHFQQTLPALENLLIPDSPIPGRSTGTTDPASCKGLKYDATDPGTVDAPTLCGNYRDEFLPVVATSAVHCMQAAEWNKCEVSRCAMNALASAPPERDAHCARVEQQCPGMSELCSAHIAGMKPAGRKRFTRCLVDNCGKGLKYCLWDPMVSPCGT